MSSILQNIGPYAGCGRSCSLATAQGHALLNIIGTGGSQIRPKLRASAAFTAFARFDIYTPLSIVASTPAAGDNALIPIAPSHRPPRKT
jgi:hypothetical protein